MKLVRNLLAALLTAFLPCVTAAAQQSSVPTETDKAYSVCEGSYFVLSRAELFPNMTAKYTESHYTITMTYSTADNTYNATSCDDCDDFVQYYTNLTDNTVVIPYSVTMKVYSSKSRRTYTRTISLLITVYATPKISFGTSPLY